MTTDPPDYQQTNWEKDLIYRHSAQGHVDRKIASIRRRGKKRYATWGLLFGLIVGAIIGYLVYTYGGF